LLQKEVLLQHAVMTNPTPNSGSPKQMAHTGFSIFLFSSLHVNAKKAKQIYFIFTKGMLSTTNKQDI